MTHKNFPLITIAIPTYNRADGYLKQALESAVNQTYQHLEIIVADNCSSDHTNEVVKKFADSRIIRYYKHAKNIGANNNFNFCVEQAQGAYFLLLHDDDWIDPDFVEICLKAANYKTDVGIIRTGTRLIDAQGQVADEVPNLVSSLAIEDFFVGWFTRKTAYYLCSTLFNTQYLKELGGFDSKKNMLQDVVAEVQLAARYGRVDVPDVKASFRKHAAEMTFAVKVNDWFEDSIFLLDLMCSLSSLDKKEMVKTEGQRFFCRFNCNLARKIKSPFERLATYWRIFREFDFRYSPLEFVIDGNRYLYRMRNVKGKLRRMLASGAWSIQ
jgi:glycosyltransferase involved in cell wall biosynthesis